MLIMVKTLLKNSLIDSFWLVYFVFSKYTHYFTDNYKQDNVCTTSNCNQFSISLIISTNSLCFFLGFFLFHISCATLDEYNNNKESSQWYGYASGSPYEEYRGSRLKNFGGPISSDLYNHSDRRCQEYLINKRPPDRITVETKYGSFVGRISYLCDSPSLQYWERPGSKSVPIIRSQHEVAIFLGIPYAQPPLTDRGLRFKVTKNF